MKERLDQILKRTLDACFRKDVLVKTPLPDYIIEVPNNANHGHFATNLPLTLASSQKRRPTEIAKIVIENLADDEMLLEKVEAAGPGFINFTLKNKAWHGILTQIVNLNDDYGRGHLSKGRRICVEFVSANPTGPLHLGHGRGAAVGDTLCRILSFGGYDVIREFYINDAGRQVGLLGESIYSRWRKQRDADYPFPEDGYQGEYISDLAEEISRKADLDRLPKERAVAYCTDRGKEVMLDEIKEDLARFRCAFHVWYRESDLYSSGLLEKTLDRMRKKGEIYEEDGALWIKTSILGDDKDRVVKKKDGTYTYFASDISYHLDKWERGFSKAINIWGADHHGYIERVKSALKANDIHEDWLTVLLIQLVKLWKGGQEIKMSKRTGQYVTLKELMDEVGVDAVRYVFLSKNHDSPLDFDIDLVKKEDSENPVYYVQYAHARICSIFRMASSRGISLHEKIEEVLNRLVLDEELALIRFMAEFPSLLRDICRTLEPHRLTYYLTGLASQFHKYFHLGTKEPANRIVHQDKELSQARLLLAQGVRVVLKNGLGLLGIHAPERM